MTCPTCGHGMRTMEVETGWAPTGIGGWRDRAGPTPRRLITTCLNHLCQQEPIDLGRVDGDRA